MIKVLHRFWKWFSGPHTIHIEWKSQPDPPPAANVGMAKVIELYPGDLMMVCSDGMDMDHSRHMEAWLSGQCAEGISYWASNRPWQVIVIRQGFEDDGDDGDEEDEGDGLGSHWTQTTTGKTPVIEA